MLRHGFCAALLLLSFPAFAAISIGPEHVLAAPQFDRAIGDPLVASNGSEMLAVWSGGSSTFALPLSRTGVPLAERATPIDTVASGKRVLDIVSDGKDFLVVTASSLTGLRTLRVETTPSLRVLSENVIVPKAANAYLAQAALAWNGSTYLLAYFAGYNSPLSAVLLDRSGAAASTPVAMTDPAYYAAVAAASNGDGFVVATTRETRILTTFAINAAGAVASHYDWSPVNTPSVPHRALAWTGRTYVFVWNDGLDDYFRSVNEVTVDASGAPTRGAVVIASGVAEKRPFARTLVATANGLVALIDSNSIAGVRIDVEGNPMDVEPSAVLARQSPPQSFPGVTADAAWNGSDVFAVWQWWEQAPVIYGATIDFSRYQNGAPLAQAANSETASAIASAGRTQLLVTAEQSPLVRWPALFVQTLIDGQPHGSKVRLTDTDGSAGTPAVASDGTNYLVVWWEQADQQTRGRIVAADGTLGTVITIAPGRTPSVTWTGDHYLVYTTDSTPTWDAWDEHLVAMRVSARGELVDPIPRPIQAGPLFRTGDARVVKTPQGLTAIFRHGELAHVRTYIVLAYDLFAARISPTGDFISTPVQLTSTAESESTPNIAVAPDGTLFATWVANPLDWRFASSATRGVILSPQVEMTQVFDTTDAFGPPQVAWTGNSFVAAKTINGEIHLDRYSSRGETLPFDNPAGPDTWRGGVSQLIDVPAGALAVFTRLMPDMNGSDTQRVFARTIYDLHYRRSLTPH